MAACTCSLCFEQATKKLQTVFNTSKICNCLDLFCTSMALKMCSGEICNNSVQFQIEIRKISHHRSSYYAELGHFTLFCRGQQRTVQSLIACKAIILLIKLFVLWHSHCRQCRGLLKPPIIQVGVSPSPQSNVWIVGLPWMNQHQHCVWVGQGQVDRKTVFGQKCPKTFYQDCSLCMAW